MSDQPPSYPPYGPPPQYGYPPPNYGMEHPQGTTVLVLGILSLVICGLIGPFAWSMGNRVLAEMDRSPGYYSNRGQVSAGRICGIVASILLIVAVVGIVIFLAVATTVSTSSDHV